MRSRPHFLPATSTFSETATSPPETPSPNSTETLSYTLAPLSPSSTTTTISSLGRKKTVSPKILQERASFLCLSLSLPSSSTSVRWEKGGSAVSLEAPVGETCCEPGVRTRAPMCEPTAVFRPAESQHLSLRLGGGGESCCSISSGRPRGSKENHGAFPHPSFGHVSQWSSGETTWLAA